MIGFTRGRGFLIFGIADSTDLKTGSGVGVDGVDVNATVGVGALGRDRR